MVDYRRQATREIVDIIRLHNRRGVFAHRDPAGSARRRSAVARHAARRLRADVARQPRLPSSSPRELLERASHAASR